MATKSETATGVATGGITAEALAKLKAPFSEDDVYFREGFYDKTLEDYVPIAYVNWPLLVDRLDEVDPNWEHSVQPLRFEHMVSPEGNNLVHISATATVTVLGVSRQAIASVYINRERDLASAAEKAETNALKRAIAKFGPGRQLYEKEGMTEDEAKTAMRAKGSGAATPRAPRAAAATASAGGGEGQPLTVKMKGAFFGMAKSGGFNGDVQALLDAHFGEGKKTEDSNFTRAEVDSVFDTYGNKR